MHAREQDLIVAKVEPPIWLGDQIRRDELLGRLDEALARRLTVIHAPAGYGKTSLLSQWRRHLQGSQVEIAWLTLEADDADPSRLARYIALAISGRARGAGANGEAETVTDLPPRAALSAIINNLARIPRTIALILDDYERAETPQVAEFLKALIRLAPANSHFVVATRDYPALDQAVLAAEEQLLELNAVDLRFSSSEAEAMLARNGSALDAEVAQAIIERTEGWPVALQLTRLSLKRGMDPQHLLQRFRGASPDLARYLSEQVLTTLPPESQEVVIRTALLDRLTGEVVNALCKCEDGWLRLEQLERHGVLLQPTSPDHSAYRYHPLFAEYLRERLARRDPVLFQTLHQCAAQWFMRQEDPAQALDHAIAAADEALISRVLEEAGGWRLIPQGLQVVVERGLARLTRPIHVDRPRLALAEVYLLFKRGEMAAARERYDDLLTRLSAADLSDDLHIEVRIVGDTLSDYENAPVSFEDLIKREAFLSTLSSGDHLVIANISETIGAKFLEGGWLERGLGATLLARSHYQALGSLYSDLFTHFSEARIRRAQGRLREAADILQRAHGLIADNFGARSDLAANCAAYQAELLYERGDRAAASALLSWALPHMENSDGWVDVYAAAYRTAMWLAAADGRVEQAHAIAERARRLAQRRRLRQLELLAALFGLELLIHFGDDRDAAVGRAQEIGLDWLAHQMAQPSPPYRPVAVTAALCRAQLGGQGGDQRGMLQELEALRLWARHHGAGRLMIDVAIQLAAASREAGDPERSRACFDEAVGLAMLQGITSPFLEVAARARPLVATAIAAGPCTDRFRHQFLQGLAKSMASQPAVTRPDALNDAEAAVLEHLSRGYSNKEIARLIGMSPDTVKYRLKSVFRKIGVSRRQDAARIGQERGIVPAPPA